MRIVVTAPSGATSSLVGAALAARLKGRFVDGEMMRSAAGESAWLAAVAMALGKKQERVVVLATGALTRAVRDSIRHATPEVRFVEVVTLDGPEVDPLAGDEPGIRVADDAGLVSVVERIVSVLR